MRPEQLYFRVLPRVVPADEVTEVVIEPIYGYYQIKEDEMYEVGIVPMEHRSSQPEYYIPSTFDLDTILKVDMQRDTEPFGNTACENTDIAEHMTEDIFRI